GQTGNRVLARCIGRNADAGSKQASVAGASIRLSGIWPLIWACFPRASFRHFSTIQVFLPVKTSIGCECRLAFADQAEPGNMTVLV
ncbi:hypothetical protein, partial [Rhizobium rhizoryzae]|uniref:hypothetical protein n=1 Tax=Rhizobium rhizoryzae TaxID=451876 RepID=UPI0028A24A17